METSVPCILFFLANGHTAEVARLNAIIIVFFWNLLHGSAGEMSAKCKINGMIYVSMGIGMAPYAPASVLFLIE